MNQQTTPPNANQAALIQMKQAQIELAIALELFTQSKYYIKRSLKSIDAASDISINQDCPQYQAIQCRLSAAYRELLEGMQIVAVPFEQQPLATLIELGNQKLNEQRVTL